MTRTQRETVTDTSTRDLARGWSWSAEGSPGTGPLAVAPMGDAAEIVLVNPTDYFLYLPLLPEVAAGVLEPRRISVSLAGTLPRRAAVRARSTSSTWRSAPVR